MKRLLKKALCLCVALIMLAAMFPMGALAAEPREDMSPPVPDWIEIPPIYPTNFPDYVEGKYIWFICKDYYGAPIAGIPFTAKWHSGGSSGPFYFGDGEGGVYRTGLPSTSATTEFISDSDGYVFIPYVTGVSIHLDPDWVSANASKYTWGMSPEGGLVNPERGDMNTTAPFNSIYFHEAGGKIELCWGDGLTQWFQFYRGQDIFAVPEDPGKDKIKHEPELVVEKTVVAVNGETPTLDVNKNPLVKAGDTVTYEFVITNVSGNSTEIGQKGDLGKLIDTFPANFSFDPSDTDNTGWTEVSDGVFEYSYNQYVYPAGPNGTPADIITARITLTLTDETTGVGADGLIKNTAVITNVKGEPWDDDDADIKPVPPATGTLTISGKKTVTGAGLADKMFSFTLKDKDGNTYSAKNDASGNFTFTTINYDKVGTHEYTVTEDTPPSGWTNNTGEIKIWVKVVLDETTNCYVATAYSKDTYADADKIVDLPGFLTFQNTYNSGGGEIPGGGTTPGGEDKDDGSGDDGNNDNGNNDNDDDDDDTDDKPVPTPPVVNTPTVQPQPSNPENTIVAIDEDRYIEYNPDGVPLGEWHLNEDNEWIFDDYMPLGSFPSTSDSSVEKAALLLAGLSLLGIVITAKSRKAKRVK